MTEICGSTTDPRISGHIRKLVFFTIGAAVAVAIWFSYNGKSVSTVIPQPLKRERVSASNIAARRDTRHFERNTRPAKPLKSSSTNDILGNKAKNYKVSVLNRLASELQHELERLSSPDSQGLSLHCGGRGWSKFYCSNAQHIQT